MTAVLILVVWALVSIPAAIILSGIIALGDERDGER